jgi:ribosomal protein L20A (L18A)
MKKAVWIRNNITMIKEGVKNGSFSFCLLRDYQMYQEFKAQTNKDKMERYSAISSKHKISEQSVQKIILKMEREL